MVFNESQRRQEFAKVRTREGFLRAGGLNIAEVKDSITFILDTTIKRFPERVSKRLASDIRAGESGWRVRTGYSRSRFRGDKRGIINDASYAPHLENKYRDAHAYVIDNIEKVANDIVSKSVAENQSKISR